MLDTKFWAKYFRVYDALNQLIPYQELMNEFTEKANLLIVGEKKIFDAGSGTGNLSIRLSREGYYPTGIDFSEEGIALHKEKDSKAVVSHGDLTKKLSFGDSSFDGVFSNNVIYTLPEEIRSEVFKEFYRVLKPGGVIVVSNLAEGFKSLAIYSAHIKKSLNQKGIISTLVEVFRFLKPTVKIFYYNILINKEHKGGKYNFLTEQSQAKLFKDAGFEVLGEKRMYGGQAVFTWGKK
jgi:ubiquinone/menaquinone biosynthesis C-methylase UbiE